MPVMTIPPAVSAVMRELEKNGYEAYLVGGCVRDALSGKEPHDFDMTTDATPEEMLRVFRRWRMIETGIAHGTVTVLSHGIPVEVTTYRLDGAYSDHRHPDEVLYTANLLEDLSRRDFTVNAMAWHPDRGLTDAFGGLHDLEDGVIRCVGDAFKRFDEDALRIVRALRFASQLDFTVAPETEEAVLALHKTLDAISVERIYTEFTKLLLGKAAARVLLEHEAILSSMIPALQEADPETLHHALLAIRESTPDSGIRWSLLLSSLSGTGILPADVFSALHADRATAQEVTLFLSMLDTPLPQDDPSLLRFMRPFAQESVWTRYLSLRRAVFLEKKDYASAGLLNRIAVRSSELRNAGCCLTVRDLKADGNDLKKAGLSGPAIGNALQSALDAVTDGVIVNEHDAIVAFIDTLSKN